MCIRDSRSSKPATLSASLSRGGEPLWRRTLPAGPLTTRLRLPHPGEGSYLLEAHARDLTGLEQTAERAFTLARPPRR